MACTVVNKHHKVPYDLYIGRGSKWGNPFAITADCTREQAIKKYREHLWQQIKAGKITLIELASLDGKTLGCFCAPRACHGHVLSDAADWAVSKLKSTSLSEK